MASSFIKIATQWVLGFLLGLWLAADIIPALTQTSNAKCCDQSNEMRQPFSIKTSSTPVDGSQGCITGRNDTSRYENLLQQIRAVVEKGDLPAVAAFSSQCDILDLYGGTAGVRRRWTSVNATVFDHWHLGSNTKSMTATILAMLIQDGQLAWNSTLGDLLPDMNLLPEYVSVSVSDLTTHHSGLSDDQLTSVLAQSYAWDAAKGRNRVAALTLSQASTSTRGSFEYANVNYILAGLLIDRLSGVPAEQVFQDRIFSPLSITDAGFGPLPEPSKTSTCQPWPHLVVPSRFGHFLRAIPYFGPVKYRDNPPSLNTAGRVHMRGWQYQSYLSAILRGAQGREIAQLGLSAESAVTLNTAVGEFDEHGCRYTFGGWRRCEDAGSTNFILTHDGSNTRYYVHAVVDTAANQTYSAFTNRGDDTAMLEMRSLVKWMREGMYLYQSVGHQDANDTSDSDLWVDEL